MLPGRRDSEGRLHVVAGPVSGTSVSVAGIKVSAIGQVHYTASAGVRYPNGYQADNTDRLGIALTTALFVGGYPRNAAGQIVGQIDGAAPLATDPYVGGVRVGANGIYCTTAAPT